MQDDATPKIRTFNKEANNVSDTLSKNRMAIRELAMGVGYLGTTFLGLGVAMQNSNNQTLKGFGTTFMFVGAIMTAVSSSVQFISAIAKMVDALKKLQVAEMLTQAFAGPVGWAGLAAGAAVAGGIYYGVSKMEKAQHSVTINQHIAGSVVTEKQLTTNVQRGLLLAGQRSFTTGVK